MGIFTIVPGAIYKCDIHWAQKSINGALEGLGPWELKDAARVVKFCPGVNSKIIRAPGEHLEPQRLVERAHGSPYTHLVALYKSLLEGEPFDPLLKPKSYELPSRNKVPPGLVRPLSPKPTLLDQVVAVARLRIAGDTRSV